MDKDILKHHPVDESQSQFESKLREVRRQKSHAEEELEAASERWRAERRRLNSEIDRLESELAEAKAPSRRKDVEGKSAGIDPLEVAKIQAAAEDKLKRAAADWETERTRLNSQISRLERAVAEAIERSSNPLRSTQPLKEQFEAKLEDAAKERLELEQQVLRVKAAWDEDKKKLTGEIIKLRRLAPPSKALEAKEKIEMLRGRTDTVEEARIKELEHKVTQGHEEMERAVREKQAAEEQLRQVQGEVQQLRRTLDDTHEQVNNEVVDQLRRQYDQKIQEMIEQKSALAQELGSASAMLQSQRSRFAEEVGRNSMDTLTVHAEVARVERVIQDIATLIDDPSTDLSTVIRKNVEKAELDAYLKGILFSLGRIPGK